MRRSAFFFLTIACALIVTAGGGAAEQSAAPQGKDIWVAILDFGYSDTSGELQNSAAQHRARLEALADGLRRDMARNGRYRIVTPICHPEPCVVGSTPLDELVHRF